MRTRLLAATLTALAAVSLAACSSSGSSSGKATAAAGSPTAAVATPSDASTPGSTASTPGTPAPSATGTADGATGAPAPGTDGSAPAKPAPPADAGLPAKPDADVTGKVVAALKAIDPAIVGDKPDQVVEQARKQCQSMYQFPKDKAKLIELADQHFTSPDHPQGFGPDTAAKINDALRATLCPPPR